ncbi:MAG: hypothetical protein KAX20_07525 [Candidatus Omnitrophica bacterium]|nr:hypothetical protein [Candidatus Omnitrophota bacterium]
MDTRKGPLIKKLEKESILSTDKWRATGLLNGLNRKQSELVSIGLSGLADGLIGAASAEFGWNQETRTRELEVAASIALPAMRYAFGQVFGATITDP